MVRQLRSGKRLASPKARKLEKQRVESIDADFVPNSPEHVYQTPADPSFRPGRFPSLSSPTTSAPKSRISKSKRGKSRKPVAALRTAVEQAESSGGIFHLLDTTMQFSRNPYDIPDPVIKRRRSNIELNAAPVTSTKSPSPKKVSFNDGQNNRMLTADPEGYAEPLTREFKVPAGLARSPRHASILSKPVDSRHDYPALDASVVSPKTAEPQQSPAQKPIEPRVQLQPEPAIDWNQMDKEVDALLESLITDPTAISLNDISACLHHLQIETRRWANEHFKFEFSTDNAARKLWPLHLLKTKYRPLLNTTQFIADGSQYGWRFFFTNPESRACLVYGIVGEYVKNHIIGHTAFGFSKEDVDELEKIDKRELYQDAFLRNKAKAEILDAVFCNKETVDRENELDVQVEDLADVILTVIEPLLPPEIFDYDFRNHQWHVKDDFASQHKRSEIRDRLSLILRKCAALHWGIRVRGGEDGTVFRIAPPVQKGEQYHEDAPFHCVNPEMMKDTAHHGGAEGKRVRKIKMTCWGRAEAYIPHGRTHTELYAIERQYRETHGMLRKCDMKFEDVEREDDDDTTAENDKKTETELDWDQVDAWYYATHKKHVNPDPPKSVKSQYMRKLGKTEGELQGWRSPFVSQHKFLSRHDVYCEWEPADKPKFNFNTKIQEVEEEPVNLEGKTAEDQMMDEKYGLPIPKNKRLSLFQAVELARKERGMWSRHPLEDAHIGLRKHVGKYWWAYESTAEVVGLILFVKLVRGLSWDDLCEMSPAKICRLVQPYIASFSAYTKATGWRMKAECADLKDTVIKHWSAIWKLFSRSDFNTEVGKQPVTKAVRAVLGK